MPPSFDRCTPPRRRFSQNIMSSVVLLQQCHCRNRHRRKLHNLSPPSVLFESSGIFYNTQETQTGQQTRLKIMALQVCNRANDVDDLATHERNRDPVIFYSDIFWPDCKPEGPLFSAEFVCLSVCLSLLLLMGPREAFLKITKNSQKSQNSNFKILVHFFASVSPVYCKKWTRFEQN